MSGTEERLLDAEAVADEIAAYIEAQSDPGASQWNDPRAICDMMRALIKSIRLGLIADPEGVTDLEEELESTLKSARAWMCVGPLPATATSVTRQMPAVGSLLRLEEDDLDLPSTRDPSASLDLPANLNRPGNLDLGSPLSQRTTARPPPGQSASEMWEKAPQSEPRPPKKGP